MIKFLICILILGLLVSPVIGCTGNQGEQGLTNSQGLYELPNETEEEVPIGWKTYFGEGFKISYPPDWFLDKVSPTEIRLIPANNDVTGDGIAAIRFSPFTELPIEGLPSSYYWESTDDALKYRQEYHEILFRDYCETVAGLEITDIKHNSPVMASRELYNDWDWLIHFSSKYNLHSCPEGHYLIGFDNSNYIKYTFLWFFCPVEGASCSPDHISEKFAGVYQSFTFIE